MCIRDRPEAVALVGSGNQGGAADGHHGRTGEALGLVRAIHALGPSCVVLTGGHREVATDVYFDGKEMVEIPGPRYRNAATHGSGCTHSAALAARLAAGDDPLRAARRARVIAADAVRRGLSEIGRGTGPVDVLGVARRSARRPRPLAAETGASPAPAGAPLT